MDDNELYEAGYNRVYDTLEPETNLDFVETIVARILKGWDHNELLCSYKLNREIGRYLSENVKDRGILKSAYEKNVPVFVPAFSDRRSGSMSRCTTACAARTTFLHCAYDPFEDLEYLRGDTVEAGTGWASSPSAVACRATGRNSLVHT